MQATQGTDTGPIKTSGKRCAPTQETDISIARQKSKATDLIGTIFPRHRVRFAAAGLLLVCVALSAVSFTTSKEGKTLFGPALGADFAGFYIVGDIYNTDGPSHVYDLDLQAKRYHELLPHEPASASLPYAHHPLLIPAFAQLAKLSYPRAYVVWLTLSAGMFAAGIALLLNACPKLSESGWITPTLLAFSFEPFIMECWHGGQIAAIGFLALSTALWCLRRERMLCAGIALSICLYKPTLLVVILPMLLFVRQWRTLFGFAIGASYIQLVAMTILGQQACMDHLHLLLNYAQRTTGGGTFFQTWKYVDLNSFVKLLLPGSPLAPIVLGALMGLSVLLIGRVSSKIETGNDRPVLLAAAISWTMVLNLYIALYDTICILPALFIIAEHLLQRERRLPSTFKWWLALIYITPCITQTAARFTGLQIYTVALAGMAVYQLLQLLPKQAKSASTAEKLALSFQ